MTWFRAFRKEFGYTYYGENRTPVTVDVQLVAVVYACVLISIATLIAAAGIKGKERWYTLLRVIFSLAVGSTILLCLFGFCWRTASIDITSPYIYRSDLQVRGTIGIHIGLQKINITLTGLFEGANNEVNYNEEVELHEFPGPLEEITHCLKRGLPQPVLNVVEYLSVDAGNLRWGRDYTLAGYFARILLWTAMSFWILGNIMICSVVFYGAVMVTLTGLCMILSTVTFHVLQPRFAIRLSSTDLTLHTSYGICFWVILLFGIITVLIGVILLALDHAAPKTMNKYLLMDTQFVKEEVYSSQIHRTSSLPYIQQNNFRRASAPIISSLTKSQSVSEFIQSNPVYGENIYTVGSSEIGNLKRCSTSPGSMQDSHDRGILGKSSHRTSLSSLHSIHEFEEEARDDDSKADDNLSTVSEDAIDNFPEPDQSHVIDPIEKKEENTADRLKNTYIDIEASHKNSFQPVKS